MTQVAYALRADYERSFQGGVLNIGDTDFDVAQALRDGGGTILVDDAEPQADLKRAVLDEHPALKRVAVKTAVEAQAEVAPDSLDDLTKDDLLKLPEAEKVDGAKGLKVDDLRAAILDVRKDGDSA